MKWSLMIMLLLACAFAGAQALPKLSVQGKNLVDPSGNTVVLRGCNLGNWLIMERWMLGLDGNAGYGDEHDLFALLDKRFGVETRKHLIDEYRDTWIQPSDFDTIKTFRFNLIRLPMDYRLFEDDSNPYHLRPDAFKWVDRCVQMATDHGIYVILDMHGIQGGQSKEDHTGQADQNKFWTDTEDQKRAAWLWTQIAAHYQDSNTVVAYDPMNEPYGGTHEYEKKAYPMLLEAIRKGDPEKLVYFHGHYDGFEYYGDPKDHGWHNVGFQMHYYPGLFGSQPTLTTHIKHFAQLADIAKEVDKLNVPFYIGEMNPVFSSLGTDLMRRHYDLHEKYGWSTTMWSYKVGTASGGYEGGSWGMVTNAKPLPKVNFANDSLETIENFIHSLTGPNWVVNEPLRQAMAPKHLDYAPLVAGPDDLGRKTVPESGAVGDWSIVDIGGAMPGSVVPTPHGYELYGSGDDVWGDHDAFRFMYRTVAGDFTAVATVDSMDKAEEYAKAGWMIRASTDANSPHLLVSVFPAGDVQMAERKAVGDTTNGTSGKSGGLPVSLKVVRQGTMISTYLKRGGDTDWQLVATSDRPDLPASCLVGLMACSHDKDSYLKIGYSHISLKN